MMSSQTVTAVVVVSSPSPSPSPCSTTSKQSNSGETQQTVLPGTTTPESLQCNNETINTFQITHGPTSTSIIFPTEAQELTQLLHGVSEPFHSILKRYHLSKRSFHPEEHHTLTTIRTHHRTLQALQQCTFLPTALDPLMQHHAQQLLASDSRLDAWAARHNHTRATLARINERLMASHSRAAAAHARREATVAARLCDGDESARCWMRGRREKWLVDVARRREAHRVWVEGFGVWVGAYGGIVREERAWEAELEAVRGRQEGFGRWVGNWQIGRYFEMVEMLCSS